VAASNQPASLQTMAPGVAAALVTTLVALLVAIPAMFGYNFLVTRIRTIALEMHNFSAELAALFERDYVNFGSAPRLPSDSGVAMAPQSMISPAPSPSASRPAPAYRDRGHATYETPPASYPDPAPTQPIPAGNPHPAMLPQTTLPAAITSPPINQPPIGPEFDSFQPPPPAPNTTRPAFILPPESPPGPPINPIAQQTAYQSKQEEESSTDTPNPPEEAKKTPTSLRPPGHPDRSGETPST
ncbi:MAG: MotA/TolQ/ExbB proton channel family protein, partial [Verrucomicrobiota bacterium]